MCGRSVMMERERYVTGERRKSGGRTEGGGGGVGGGAFMHIFIFGLVFSVSCLSEERYNPSSETYS